MARKATHEPRPRSALSSPDPGQDRTLAPNAQEPDTSGELLPPGDLEAQIERFIDHYNNRRYHESLENLTPADVYFGRGQAILLERARIKRKTIAQRRLLHQNIAA